DRGGCALAGGGVERGRGRPLPGHHRPGRAAVLEADPGHGADTDAGSPAASAGWIRSRPMAESSYDCIVIGSGPGGYVAAIRAAQLGKTTAVIESDKVGGRCLNYACIPAKAVLRAGDVLSEIRDSEEYGLKVSGVQVDYAAVQARRERVVNTLTSGVAGLFRKHEIDLVEGRASLSADGGVSVDGEAIGAGMVILATGSVPLAIPGTSFGGRVIGTEEVY